MLIFTVNCVCCSISFPLSAAGGSLHSHHQSSFWDQTAAQTIQCSQTLWSHHQGNTQHEHFKCGLLTSWLNKSLREELKIKCHDKISKDFSSMWVVLLRLFVLQDYNDHIAEISAKLVAIMDSLFEKVLSKVRWGQGTREHFMNGFKFYASIKIILFTEDFQL